jgi:glycosyltransferase involved in cell wall biosynthesis
LRIICVGSYIPLKNHLALIEDVANLADVSLTIVGGGPLRAAYEQQITQLRLQARVKLVPWMSQHDLAVLLAKHDAYVHYSTTEGLSRAILEAMAVGLPVVATRVGFVDGVLLDGVNALVLDKPWRGAIERDYSAAAVFGQYRSAILSAAVRPGAAGALQQ